MAVFDAETLERLKKPVKGSLTLARRESRKAIAKHERDVKEEVRRRDGARACRLDPDCPYVKEGIRTEGCHLEDKGSGGDHGVRTSPELMVRGCTLHHTGADSLHQGTRRVKYLTDRKANGPIALERPLVEIDRKTRIEETKWVEFAREKAVGVWMTPREFAVFRGKAKS